MYTCAQAAAASCREVSSAAAAWMLQPACKRREVGDVGDSCSSEVMGVATASATMLTRTNLASI